MVGAPHYEHTLRCYSSLTHPVNQAVDGSVYGILILVSLVRIMSQLKAMLSFIAC